MFVMFVVIVILINEAIKVNLICSNHCLCIKMHNDMRCLLDVVSRAVGHELNMDDLDDRFMMQRGCYILNSWGYGPMYRFDLYIRGPYSSDLADERYESNGLIDD